MQEAIGCRYKHRQAQSYNICFNYFSITTYVIFGLLNSLEVIARWLALRPF